MLWFNGEIIHASVTIIKQMNTNLVLLLHALTIITTTTAKVQVTFICTQLFTIYYEALQLAIYLPIYMGKLRFKRGQNILEADTEVNFLLLCFYLHALLKLQAFL